MILYNICLHIYYLLARIASLRLPKAKQWCEGRVGLLDRMEREISPNGKIIWIHAASLGEFEQGRSIIERVRATHPDHKILITFYSPSGYEHCKGYKGADYIYYLPLDTPRNVREFLDIVNPRVAIFVKYEYWFNTLFELRRRSIRSYVVSAIFRPNSIFFKWWGGMWRRALRSFDVIFVQDEESKRLLSNISISNVVVAGDTRFDRVYKIATEASRDIPIIERFKGGERLLVAGSTWPADEELLHSLCEAHGDLKIVVVPHEIDTDHIGQIKRLFAGRAIKYSSIKDESEVEAMQVLILDTMGMLSSSYKYGDMAYIGGGFGVGIHNTLEAATFGVPIAFGTNYHKFKEAVELISIDAATSVGDAKELNDWATLLLRDESIRLERGGRASEYVLSRCGATESITNIIFDKQ